MVHCLIAPIVITLLPIFSFSAMVDDLLFHKLLLWVVLRESSHYCGGLDLGFVALFKLPSMPKYYVLLSELCYSTSPLATKAKPKELRFPQKLANSFAPQIL